MILKFRFPLPPVFLIAGISLSVSLRDSGAGEADSFRVGSRVDHFLGNYCLTCHDGDVQKGDLRLDRLEELSLTARLEVLNRMHEQLYLEQMPPRDEDRPSPGEREEVIAWVVDELKKHGPVRLTDKLRYPSYGNYVDHEALFSGKIEAAPFTPARRWLVSPWIFEERVREVLAVPERERQRSLYGITNPFLLPEQSGVRDYDNGTLDGGHLLVMLNNAEWISTKQIRAARVKAGEIAADEFPNPKDRWAPRETPAAFETIILKDSVPDESEIDAAIRTQFERVLGREPEERELRKYRELTRDSIALAGNAEGLRQMLLSVLLESEFLYRIEFGAGEADEWGRRPLAPHEAARAISYALGDRGPDEALREAAEEGRLVTREDYRREVERLLADETYYAGPVDKGVSGKNMRSHETSHPRLVRFFREFFGYTGASRVFKDIERSDGFYQNPSRGTMGTPGFLIKEADRVVDWYLKKDEDVFENLLTTEVFFVYHDKDNETGKQVIAEWEDFYETLKDTDWKKHPEKVIEENLEFIQSKKSIRILGGRQRREMLRYMYFFGETLGKGRTPFTTPSFAHGYYYNHSPFYNLPPTPNPFRYGPTERENFGGFTDNAEFWDYPVEQPFRIEKRKGLLTHPAWLIAHSANFHTDPVRRGKWVREKLLAGRVPDLPITVDAQIPGDHHRTLRDRLEEKTRRAECWKCHEQMNPLGLPFEIYDDFGRFRLDEPLEHPDNVIAGPKKKNGATTYATRPVDSTGFLEGTGDPELDGEVTDALDLIDRLARSERVRQSIIRHAFRFFLGRNEMLSDSRTLIDADRAYLESGGSFRAVTVSLLTSDSFRYRKPIDRNP